MSDAGNSSDVLQELRALLDSGDISAKVASQGQRIFDRVTAPVNIAVLGLPKSGKSQLINVLVGSRLIPENCPWPSLDIQWGAVEHTKVTFDDVDTVTRKGVDLGVPAEIQPVRAVIESPAAIFKKISLIESALDGAESTQTAALARAINTADIILWCTQEFSTAELQLWNTVPDAKKDHSFCVLTKADVLSAQGNLADRIEQIQDTVSEEFHSLIPVATLQAIDASLGDGATATKALLASGGKALMDAVFHQVDAGRRGNVDNALIFLSRYGANSKKTASPKSKSNMPSSNQKNRVKSKMIAAGLPLLRISEAISYLQDRGAALIKTALATDDQATEILDHCVATSTRLAEILSDEDEISVTDQELQDDVMESVDVILLMQLEKGLGAAADAVTVLLQIRRGLEARIAA